jgi:hypothetical protein
MKLRPGDGKMLIFVAIVLLGALRHFYGRRLHGH